LRTNNFDPLEYIESAFLDREEAIGKTGGSIEEIDGLSMTIPSLTDYLRGGSAPAPINRIRTETEAEPIAEAEHEDPEASVDGKKAKFRKTVMSAPRPRRSHKKSTSTEPSIDPELQVVWQALPKNVAFLCSFYDDSVTKNYYRGEFKESRQELIRRLLDPELSLEETSRLLGVCPATVRRYTNRSWLAHHRTTGGQRRFRLSDIVNFVETHGRFPEEAS